jgi:protein ImuB
MLWFALHLSALPLEAWLAAAGPQTPQRPSCVVAARRVVLADATARAAGVEPGMSAATAASLAAGLQMFARDAAREAAQVQRLALTLAQFTPTVIVQSDGVLLEVAASLRLFGGAGALWRLVRAAVRQCCVHSLAMAAASTATAASVLARTEPRSMRLRRLPVNQRLDALPLAAVAAAWQIEPRLVDLLQGIGCRTLGDVRVLPRTGAQRRGAAALLERAARAYGEAPDPQIGFEPPRTFEMGLELLHRADDAAMLVFAVQRLVQPLAGWLAQQWLAAARLALVLRHETSLRHAQPDTVVTLALADPTRDAGQIALLLRERLQRLALPAPVYALTLRLDEAVPHAGHETALWREAGQGGRGEDAKALFDRLAARLGPERVCRPRLAADHRPERAMTWQPLHEPADAAGARPPAGGAPRPTWLLPEPQRLAEDAASGRPLLHGAPLVLAGRAERIEAGWFDGQLVSRDYHVARAKDQRWLWVFRERRGALAQWYLHGVFG